MAYTWHRIKNPRTKIRCRMRPCYRRATWYRCAYKHCKIGITSHLVVVCDACRVAKMLQEQADFS